jgi:uncharacterized protein YqjF (DUF2071 family)
MAGRVPQHRVRVVTTAHHWDSLTFLHWSYPISTVARLLPPGLQVDPFQDLAWVGLTPFVMGYARVGLGPAPPSWRGFPETNVRTYVRGPDGRDGLWFLSLDCTPASFVLALRAAGLPYFRAQMRVDRAGESIDYRMRRLGGDGPASRVRIRSGAVLEHGERAGLVDFLTGRWGAYTRCAGQLWYVPVAHQPWPLRQATVDELDDELVAAGGLPVPDARPLAHFSPGVHARVGTPRRCPPAHE